MARAFSLAAYAKQLREVAEKLQCELTFADEIAKLRKKEETWDKKELVYKAKVEEQAVGPTLSVM